MLNTILNVLSFGYMGDEGASLQNAVNFAQTPAMKGFAALQELVGSNAVLTTFQTQHANLPWAKVLETVPSKYVINNAVVCFIDYKGRYGVACEYGGKVLIVKQKTINTFKLYAPVGVECPMYPNTTDEWNAILHCFATRIGVKTPVLVKV